MMYYSAEITFDAIDAVDTTVYRYECSLFMVYYESLAFFCAVFVPQ